ncbi:MAG: hypothetical protein IPJ07_23235 [Acidobacteria bacterium]|nr:hypothetical protein [Acidobacteriota bacterium]
MPSLVDDHRVLARYRVGEQLRSFSALRPIGGLLDSDKAGCWREPVDDLSCAGFCIGFIAGFGD